MSVIIYTNYCVFNSDSVLPRGLYLTLWFGLFNDYTSQKDIFSSSCWIIFYEYDNRSTHKRERGIPAGDGGGEAARRWVRELPTGRRRRQRCGSWHHPLLQLAPSARPRAGPQRRARRDGLARQSPPPSSLHNPINLMLQTMQYVSEYDKHHIDGYTAAVVA